MSPSGACTGGSDRPATVSEEVQPGHVDQRPPSARLHVRLQGVRPGFLVRQMVPCQARQGERDGRGPHRAAEHPRSRRSAPRARRCRRRRVAGLGGDRALFVGRSYPFYAAGTRGWCSGLRANCVYAADLSAHAAIVLGLRQGCAGGFEPLAYPSVGGPLRRPIWFRPTADLRGQVSCCRSFSMTVAYRQAHQHPVASIVTCLVYFTFCIFVFLEKKFNI